MARLSMLLSNLKFAWHTYRSTIGELHICRLAARPAAGADALAGSFRV
jgi:hypothetical protein